MTRPHKSSMASFGVTHAQGIDLPDERHRRAVMKAAEASWARKSEEWKVAPLGTPAVFCEMANAHHAGVISDELAERVIAAVEKTTDTKIIDWGYAHCCRHKKEANEAWAREIIATSQSRCAGHGTQDLRKPASDRMDRISLAFFWARRRHCQYGDGL